MGLHSQISIMGFNLDRGSNGPGPITTHSWNNWAQASHCLPPKTGKNILDSYVICILFQSSTAVKMAYCSSKWWQAPVFFSISVVLAFFAISTALHSRSQTAIPPNRAVVNELSLNASKALRNAGFNMVATLIQVSPELFFSGPDSTIFAIKDSSISNNSLPPWLLKNLIKYHISPSKLSMKDLLKKPRGACLPTLLPRKKIAITRMNFTARLVEINHISVSHPDIFLEGNVSIHGVLGPFSPLDPLDVHQGWNFIQAPFCDSNSTLISDTLESKNGVEWRRIIRWLSSNGFVPFAIGLQSALEGILQDHMGLRSITVFVPPNLPSVASPSHLLKQAVRLHILPKKITYKELASFPSRTSLKTLASDQDLEVLEGVVINGVKIITPEILCSENYIIHGISRAFEIVDLPHTSR